MGAMSLPLGMDAVYRMGLRSSGVRNRGSGEDGKKRLLEEDNTWHNPTLMQMVETLQTVMMNKRDALAPIPVM